MNTIDATAKSYVNRHGARAPSPPTEVGLARLRHQKCPGRAGPTCGGEGRGEGAPPRVVADDVFRGDAAPLANAAAFGAADWLSLAAAPTFAVMALLTGVLGGPRDVLCSMMQGTSPLSGMVPMYLLMSAFHLAPWLKLIRN